ncbi:hypothetical protein DFJ43DRAFT_1155729 [Lentinula guzmanii]|uniref:Rho-GAP domain-containing protein n=1 Tax=Lentinula guzmanii TaxID=2804957 RepID=A0AA38JIJ3_9AGAR|nr:hypothetical protein DFJ43DRAFT_1155729 [Lentinula guzmanii]
MPLFFSKVFGRKKHEDKASTSSKSSASPLEGKFEYVIPSPSPEKRPDYPHLSLNLPERRENRVLSNIFENGDVAGRTRLSTEQALVIVRTCSQVIIARGLETLGIMHPHWHSASPATQQRLILLFIQSSAADFESEINSTRSAHDVAAVIRWALRHLELPGPSFGNDQTWYHNFFEAEQTASYPPKSFSEILAPQLPPVNLELLTTTLDLFSSLAAHSEANGISGSKLSKLLGLWLLTAERSTPGDDFLAFYTKWDKYGRILEHLFLSHIRNEIANHRMPKRLVELVKHYPYAGKTQSSTEQDLLPRPRFSTRRYDALFVHIDTESPISGSRASKVSLQIVVDALNAITPSTDAPPYSIWQKVQQGANAGDEEMLYSPSIGKFPGVGRILSDETLGILSLLAEDEIQRESSINFISHANSPQENGAGRRTTSSYARQMSTSSSDTVTPQRPNLNTLGLNLDWGSFSSSGFSQSSPLLTPLAETLLESKDSEVTSPSLSPSRKGSKKSVKTPLHQSRRSLDVLPPITIPTTSGTGFQLQSDPTTTSGMVAKTSSRVTKVELISLDEGFIDFWNDSLLDPITNVETWPRFVICRLKASVTSELVTGEGGEGKKVEWMVVEQQYVKPTPNLSSVAQSPISPSADTIAIETSEGPATVESASSPQSPAKRASSPRPSLSSLNASVKRFSFWAGSKKDKGDKEDSSSTATAKKKAKGVKVGEMGEILFTEGPKSPKASSPPKKTVEVPPVVREEQESHEIMNDVPVAKMDAEVGGEPIPVSEIAAVTAGITSVVAETTANVQQDNDNAPLEVKEVQKKVDPAVTEATNELGEQDMNGISTLVPVSQQEESSAAEPSSIIQADETALDNTTTPEPANVTPPVAETLQADADGFVAELIPTESAIQVQGNTALEESAEQPSDVQVPVAREAFVAEGPDNEFVAESPHVAAETVTEPIAINEPVADVSELTTSEQHVSPATDEPTPVQQGPTSLSEELVVPSIPEAAQAITAPASVQEPVVVVSENAATDETVRTSEELVTDDTPEPAESATVPILQEAEEEIVLANHPKEPEPVLSATSLTEELVLQEDAPLDDAVSASEVQPILAQESNEPQIDSQTSRIVEAVSHEEEDVPISTVAPGDPNLVGEQQDKASLVEHIEDAEMPPVVDEGIVQEAEIVSEPTYQHEDPQHSPESLTNDPASVSDSTSSAPVESIPAEVAESFAVPPKAVEPVTTDVNGISLSESAVPETGDNTQSLSADAAAAPSPGMEPASEVAVTSTATPVQEQEVSGDVEIEPRTTEVSTEPVADTSEELEPELAPSAPVESVAPSVNLAPEGAEDALPEAGAEDIPAQGSSEPAEIIADVHSVQKIPDEVHDNEAEPLVRSELLREPSPGTEDDAISLAEVPVVTAPVILPVSPSIPSVNIDTPPEEEKEEVMEAPINDNLPDNHLPPAPQTIVLSGGTVGPALALSSSEAITTAQVGETSDTEETSQTVGDELKIDDVDVAVDVEGTEEIRDDSQVSESNHGDVEAQNEAEPANPMEHKLVDVSPST